MDCEFLLEKDASFVKPPGEEPPGQCLQNTLELRLLCVLKYCI